MSHVPRNRSAAKDVSTASPFSQTVIVLHTRPSCCLSVSALSITFACHAFCCNKSNIDAAAVSRRGTQSLYINVRLSAGLTTCCLCCGGGTRTRAHLTSRWYFLSLVAPFTSFLRFQSSIPICHLSWLVEPVLKRAMGGTRTRVFAKVHTVIIMPYHSATIAFASAYLRRRQKPLYY